MINDLGFQWFAMRTTAIEEFTERMIQCEDPNDPDVVDQIVNETGLNLFDITDREFESIMSEVERRRW